MTNSVLIMLDEKFKKIFTNSVISLLIVASIGIIIRLYYFPYGIPVSLDALLYFWYASDTTTLAQIPTDYTFPNNLWPLVLSAFFSVVRSDNFLDLMYVQRFATIAISVTTIVPMYLLCRKFFDKTYALIGTALFVLEPRIIQNSMSGVTEPLFIMLGTSTFVLFLNSRMKIVYASFATAALFALVRYEGLLLIIPLTIMFFIRFRGNRKVIFKYIVALSIFVLVLLPMAYVRIQSTGHDGLISHVIGGAKVASTDIISSDQVNTKFSLINGAYIFGKLVSWSTIPMYFLFILFGIYMIFRNKNHNNYTIILGGAALLLPAIYAYSRGIEEVRYLFIIFPLFSLISLFTIKNIVERFERKNIILVSIVIGIIISSMLFLNWKIDNEYERESVRIAEEVAKRTTVINDYHPESVYLRTVGFSDLQDFSGKRMMIHGKITVLFAEKFTSLKEFLNYGQDNGLKYLLVDDKKNRPEFLLDIFEHEKSYPYLIKEFDSTDIGFKYHVKIFKINYDALNAK